MFNWWGVVVIVEYLLFFVKIVVELKYKLDMVYCLCMFVVVIGFYGWYERYILILLRVKLV